MGMGPKGTSLLARLGRPTEPLGDTLWIQIDQQERGEARMRARIRYGEKHKTPKKPLAPVEQTNEKHPGDGARLWKWIGEEIASKGLLPGDLYASDQIREAGFKTPKLTKKPLAPVEEVPRGAWATTERAWKWVGEDLPSKGLFYDSFCSGKELREAGFQLPKLVKKLKKEKK